MKEAKLMNEKNVALKLALNEGGHRPSKKEA